MMGANGIQQIYLESKLIWVHLHQKNYALWSLVLGIRILSEQECAEWIGKYERAFASLVDRDLKLTNLAVDIEKDIHIVATTAIEDKLQDGVPEPISNIGRPG